MNVRFAHQEEINNWDELITLSPAGGNILQGKIFAQQKEENGWTPRYIVSDNGAVLALEKSVIGLGKVWYCPKGPCVENVEQLHILTEELIPFAKSNGVFSLKIEPELDHESDMSRFGFIKTKPIQAIGSTVLIDLSPSLEEIMKNFNQKGRHAINRARRDGVTAKKVDITDENCAIMYDLFKQTSQGAGFAIRPPEYYKSFYERYENNGGLFFAYFEGAVVAAAFATILGEKSVYKDGASVRERPVYGASHLLQWEVIQWAKSRGSLEHDLAGVPPIADIKNTEHPLYGLGRFKTSFNKTVTEYVGAYDIPVRPLKAKLWHNYIEKIVRRLYYRRHKQSYY